MQINFMKRLIEMKLLITAVSSKRETHIKKTRTIAIGLLIVLSLELI